MLSAVGGTVGDALALLVGATMVFAILGALAEIAQRAARRRRMRRRRS